MPEPTEPTPSPRSNLRRSRLPLVALAVGVLAGAVAYLLFPRQPAEPPAGQPVPAPSADPAAASTAPSEDDRSPPVAEADVRSLLESLSPDALFRRWLAEGDAIRRWAVVTDNLAEGVSPRRELALLAPAGRFAVASRGGALVIAPESYRRYDPFADAVAAVDAGTAASVYRALRRPLGAAYRALGYPGRSFDQVTARALSRLERAPVRDAPVEVVDEGGIYLFADRALEEASQVDKHLLRMGPRNTRRVQAKAREIREALGLPAELRAH
jgi:hypothetical protein